jgi:hypothetical protein
MIQQKDLSENSSPFLFFFKINNYMLNNKNVKIYSRMIIYTFLTVIITFFSLIDTLDVHSLSSVSQMDWIKLLCKSFATGLISLKAFFDDTVNKTQEKSTEEGE